MFDTITAWIASQAAFNTYAAIFLYWAPLSLCTVGYTWRTWINFQKDKSTRAQAITTQHETEWSKRIYYSPTDTIGSLIGRAIVTICPIANIWAALFDVVPEMFEGFLKRMFNLFNQPLVPPPSKDK